MRTKCLICVLVIYMASFLFSYHVSKAEEESGVCPKPYIETIFPRAAQSGDQIKIRGRRFGTEQGAVVFTPEVEAEIVNWTMHRIWVMVPESATTGPVIVRLPCGSESNMQYFTVKK